ncbi:glycoside hydrolase family 16 protein, partial [Tulasnella calospora MUT 4182]
MLSFNTLSLVLTALVSATISGASSPPKGGRFYSVADTYIGNSFLTGFDHQTFLTDGDPTHGRVNYTDQAFAVSQNLTFTSTNTLIMRADYTTVLKSTDAWGRNAVRIQSKKSYGTSVTIMDLRHMPEGCATWPAFWVTWPNMGEIDILEGVNDSGPNAATLHTLDGCTMSSANMIQTGTLTPTATNCYAYVNYNTGCSVKSGTATSYGPSLNAVGGGWYAMERTSNFINVWWWARNDPAVPPEVKNGNGLVNPAHWGKPFANFVNNNCDLSTKMGPHNIIINLTFC